MRKPKSCLGNSKLGPFASRQNKCAVCAQPLLELKTRPRFCCDSSSLSIGGLATVADQSAHNAKSKGLNPMTGMARKKMAERLFTAVPSKYMQNEIAYCSQTSFTSLSFFIASAPILSFVFSSNGKHKISLFKSKIAEKV